MEDEIYLQNSHIIRDRWPQLWETIAPQDINSIPVTLREGLCNTISISDIQLSSRHDRKAESRFQAASIPDTETVYVYGPGLGDLPIELLKRDSLECLEVKIMNPAVFSVLLYLHDQLRWLNEPRVNLSLAANDAEIGLPFFANPAELLLAEDHAGAIKQRLEAEISHDFVNSRFEEAFPEIQARIESNLQVLESDADVRALYNTCDRGTAYVIGAGPTLTESAGRLKELLNKQDTRIVIAVDTALPFLIANDITPDIVVSIDRKLHSAHFDIKIPDSIKLVYQPLLCNEVISLWNGPRYAAYSYSPVFDAVRESIPKACLFSAGSVIHPSIDLAVKMGCSKLVLLGCDFGYPLGRTHAGWDDGDLGPSMDTATSWALNGNNIRIKSDANFNSYRCELERYISYQQDVTFYNTSREGAKISGCEYMEVFCE